MAAASDDNAMGTPKIEDLPGGSEDKPSQPSPSTLQSTAGSTPARVEGGGNKVCRLPLARPDCVVGQACDNSLHDIRYAACWTRLYGWLGV